MIHLDANVLIAMAKVTDAHHAAARAFAAKPHAFSTSAVAWMEFLSRPVPPACTLALQGILTGGILPFDQSTAALAGELFHLSGAKRRTRLDCMIAAAAILADAQLATTNPDDFTPFIPLGLKLLHL